MPELCRFFGIIITMNWGDHAPPHFHVRCGEQKGIVALDDLRLIKGNVTPQTMAQVRWAALHPIELARDWAKASRHEELSPIPPLE